MKQEIPLDDPFYSNKHVKAIGGWGWHFLCLLLLIGWLVTFVMMVSKDEFSFWPLAFFIGAVAAGNHTGKKLLANGYLHSAERKKALDAQAKDREDA